MWLARQLQAGSLVGTIKTQVQGTKAQKLDQELETKYSGNDISQSQWA